MKVLVTGAGGMLARALVPRLEEAGHEVVPLNRAALDVTEEATVASVVQRIEPEVVIQCAAYTNVDGAEKDEAGAFLLNAEATSHVGRVCQKIGAVLVYPSTDYVFSGESEQPYQTTDPISPLNAYGRSKAAGEEAARQAKALIVRTSWLYGFGGRNFVETISRLAAEREELRIVADQVGLPTWTSSLSGVIVQLLKVRALGTFHAADGVEAVSWYQFAQEILDFRGLKTKTVPVSSASYGAAAKRPRYSVLDCTSTEEVIGAKMPVRKAALAEYISNLDSP